MSRRLNVLAAVAAGGALGAPARYGVSKLIHVPPGGFPWATFWTNASGSFALGFVVVVLVTRFPPSRYARAFFAAGFLGAFTTFSTFAVEADLLVKDGYVAMAALYVGSSIAVGLTLVWVGARLARLVTA